MQVALLVPENEWRTLLHTVSKLEEAHAAALAAAPAPDDILTVPEAAAALGLTPEAVRRADELPALFEQFTVTGFSMGRNQAGVTLIGQRVLTGGRVLNLTTPYQSFDDEQGSYPYAPLLETELLEALAEVEAALRGKCTDYRQLDLFEQFATPLIPLQPAA